MDREYQEVMAKLEELSQAEIGCKQPEWWSNPLIVKHFAMTVRYLLRREYE